MYIYSIYVTKHEMIGQFIENNIIVLGHIYINERWAVKRLHGFNLIDLVYTI